MKKIGLVIQREYINRVKKKSFILMTFLAPLLMGSLIMVPLWLSSFSDNTTRNIYVIDSTGLYADVFRSSDNYTFSYSKNNFYPDRQTDQPYAYIVITDNLLTHPKSIAIYSDKQVSLDFKKSIQDRMNQWLGEQKLLSYNIPEIKKIIENTKINIDIPTIVLNQDGSRQETSAEFATLIGMASTLIIYLFLLLYGAQIMQSVMQEKTNRIVEIMVSSVRPFDLMFGKIIAVGLVGLTQLFLWLILFSILIIFFGITFSISEISALASGQLTSATLIQNNEILQMISGIPFTNLIFSFIFYFIGGYLLYASVFAAIGSAVDTESDTQQFMIPVTVLIIFALYTGLYSAQNPDGPLALWCSFIPFTSPIVMMVRIPFGVPFWQIILSLLILAGTAICSIWASGRVYRIGILMYGKKNNYHDLLKWIRSKN